MWNYLENGGRRAEVFWHRRAGKDDLALHFTATAAMQKPATYWHMLPEYAQGRKAIWDAINPKTNIRRIDEAFPEAIRKRYSDQKMFIEFINGATWQVVGSDNYNSLVGSPPYGIIRSERAVSNPATDGYLAPILLENGGWQISISTPRGKNHAYKAYLSAKSDPSAFAEILTAEQTGVFTPEQLKAERARLIEENGESVGVALFEQEYMCSFEAAILGAIYVSEITKMRSEKRLGFFPHDPNYPVTTAWDLGKRDATAIWFAQFIGKEIRLIDFYMAIGSDPDDAAKLIHSKPYAHVEALLPHDGGHEFYGMKHTRYEQLQNLGLKPRIVPIAGKEDGIRAVKAIFNRLTANEATTAQGIEALSLYQRKWDDKRKVFSNEPLHDWTSDPADALRTLAMGMKEQTSQATPRKRRVLSGSNSWMAN